jgi:hypothetical protein
LKTLEKESIENFVDRETDSTERKGVENDGEDGEDNRIEEGFNPSICTETSHHQRPYC